MARENGHSISGLHFPSCAMRRRRLPVQLFQRASSQSWLWTWPWFLI